MKKRLAQKGILSLESKSLSSALGLMIVAILLLAPTHSLHADEKQTAAQCQAAFTSCEASCSDQHQGDSVEKAQCRATCQASYAACDAAAAFEQAKPWVEEQWERTKDFIDGLLGGEKSPPAPRPGEQKI